MAYNQWIEWDFDGLDGQIYRLEKLKSSCKTDIDRILLRAALTLQNEVQRVITTLEYENYKGEIKTGLIDTGLMRANIFSFVRLNLGFTEGVVGIGQKYAPYLNFGTGEKGKASGYPDVPSWYQYGEGPGMRAFKFVLIAWTNKKDEIYSMVRQELRRLVNQV